MREILTRFGRHNIGFLWLFVEPMVFTLAITILWNMLHDSKEGMSVTAFVMTGYSTLLLWRNMPSRCASALQPNYSLLFHRQVRPLDIYCSRVALEAIGATTSLITLTLLFSAAGLMELPKNILWASFGWLMLMWYASAVALTVGALSEKSEIVDKIWHPFMYIMVPLSGCFFTVASVPEQFREILLYNPMISWVEIFREGYMGDSHVWFYHVLYATTCNMVLTLIAFSLVRRLRVAPTG